MHDDLAAFNVDAELGLAVIDLQGAAPGDAATSHASRDDGGVRGHAAAGGEDALRRLHAVDVLRRRLDAYEDDFVAQVHCLHSVVGAEHDPADRRTRRCGQALRDDIAGGRRVEGGMQQLIQLVGLDAQDGFVLAENALAHEVDGDLDHRLGRALAVARLQEPELLLLDRELDVLHVAVVRFEGGLHAHELRVRLRHRLFQRHLAVRLRGDCHRLGRTDARDDVLALGVHQVLAVEAVLAGGGVAGEADAGGAFVAQVAEDHGLHVDGRTPAVGDLVHAAVVHGARVVPGAEHSADSPPELVPRVFRELDLLRLPDLVLVLDHELLERRGGQLRIQLDTQRLFLGFEDALEGVAVHVFALDAEHDVAVHRDEAAVGVVGEAVIAGLARQALRDRIVEAEVEHRVHHAGHRDAGAGAHGDEQRAAWVAKAAFEELLDEVDTLAHLVLQAFGILATELVEGCADLRRDREAGRHGYAEVGHLGQPRALASQQVTHFRGTVRLAVAEEVDKLLSGACLSRCGFCRGHALASLVALNRVRYVQTIPARRQCPEPNGWSHATNRTETSTFF